MAYGLVPVHDCKGILSNDDRGVLFPPAHDRGLSHALAKAHASRLDPALILHLSSLHESINHGGLHFNRKLGSVWE